MKLQKKSSFLIAIVLFFMFIVPARLCAQVSMQLKVVQNNFLQYESVFLRLAIRNMSAHPLAFGEAGTLKGKLWFEVIPADAKEHKVLQLLPDMKAPELTGLILAPGTNRTFLFNLTNHYDIRKIGKYSVRAVISHPQLENSYQSNEDFFNVLRGTEVWSRTVGLPLLDESKAEDAGKNMTAASSNADSENVRKIGTRKYRILKYNTGKQSVYCLSIEDKNNVYFLRHIGFDLGAELKPKCEIDFLSRLNVLIAASTKVFAYYLYNTDGELEKKNILIKSDSEPFLATDLESGIVHVVGGREARKDVDYEEIRDLPFLEDMSDTEYFYESGDKDGNDDERYQGLEDKDKNKKYELTEDDIESFGADVIGESRKNGKKMPTGIESAGTKMNNTTKSVTAGTASESVKNTATVTSKPEKKTVRTTNYENSELDSIFEDL